jgi:signal transduction histidine kinase
MKPNKFLAKSLAFRDLPVSAKVMAIAAGMSLFLGAGLLLPLLRSHQQLGNQAVYQHARYLAQDVAITAGSLLQSGALPELQTLLDKKIHLRPAIGTSITSLEVRHATGVVARAVPAAAVKSRGPAIEASAALPSGTQGSIHVALDGARIGSDTSGHTGRVLATVVMIAVFGSVAVWRLIRIAIRPIQELVFSANAIQEGWYFTRTPVRTDNEVGRLAVAFNRMAAALEEKDRLNAHLIRKVIAASEDERKRVARELHNKTELALNSLIVSLASIKHPASADHLAELRALAVKMLEEIHDLCLTLRPSALDDLGLTAALDHHRRRFARLHGVEVSCWAAGLDDGTRLPAEVEVALYRIVQEALSNAVRHGKACYVEVLLQCKDDSVLAVIEDDGQGFHAHDWRSQCLENERLGLLGIEERARLLGGHLRVDSQPGIGARLFVEVPLPKDWAC